VASCIRSRTIRNDRKERNGTSRVHTMYEKRDSDHKRRERESPTQPDGVTNNLVDILFSLSFSFLLLM